VPIDYLVESEKYRPSTIKTLLIGEAPPPNGESYFYLPTAPRNISNVRNDRSLPATIFNHYFGKRPKDADEYHDFLIRLKKMGIFLMDIFDKPIKVRNSDEGLQKIIRAIPKFRSKLKKRNIKIEEEKIVFLLARNSYKNQIRESFPKAKLVKWINFRMNEDKIST